MYVVLRDLNGVPVLTPEGYVQPLDSSGNPIPLDAEGNPVDETATVEVELGRLNVSRAPASVLENRMREAVSNINKATELKTDEAGRIVIVTADGETTIDSPLENLALYKALMSTGSINGLSLNAGQLGSLANIGDGTFTIDDVKTAASFLAAAADKSSPLSVDEVVYLNSILGVDGSVTGADGRSYVDFTGFTYDRAEAYAGKAVDILVKQDDGSYATQTINVYDTVFNGANVTEGNSADAFTRAADDARAVINYVHEYSTPEEGGTTH